MSRAELNGRMRDFYDVYLIYTKNRKNIDNDNFKKAINKTFSKREYSGEPFATINLLRDSKLLKTRWNQYQKKYDYAKNIEINDILNFIEQMIEEIELVIV